MQNSMRLSQTEFNLLKAIVKLKENMADNLS